MRRVFSFMLLIAVILVPVRVEADRVSPRERQCRFQWVDPAKWTAKEERLTAGCVVQRWSVSGGIEKFTDVIQCESGWWRFAIGRYGHLGLGQHDPDSWDGRVKIWEPNHWTLRPSWKNSRTQITVTARMAHVLGWWPWSGCA